MDSARFASSATSPKLPSVYRIVNAARTQQVGLLARWSSRARRSAAASARSPAPGRTRPTSSTAGRAFPPRTSAARGRRAARRRPRLLREPDPFLDAAPGLRPASAHRWPHAPFSASSQARSSPAGASCERLVASCSSREPGLGGAGDSSRVDQPEHLHASRVALGAQVGRCRARRRSPRRTRPRRPRPCPAAACSSPSRSRARYSAAGGRGLRRALGRDPRARVLVHVAGKQEPAGLDRSSGPEVDGDALAERELAVDGARGALADEHPAPRRQPRHPIGGDRRVARHHRLRRLGVGNDHQAGVDADPDVERRAHLVRGRRERLHGADDLGRDVKRLRRIGFAGSRQPEHRAQPVPDHPLDHARRAGRAPARPTAPRPPAGGVAGARSRPGTDPRRRPPAPRRASAAARPRPRRRPASSRTPCRTGA